MTLAETPDMMLATQPNKLSSNPQDEKANCPGLPPASFSDEHIKLFEKIYHQALTQRNR